jgi:hypothetical protein
MKKIAHIFLMAGLFFPMQAQFRYGFQGGMNVTTQIARNYNADYAKNKFLIGFNTGPVIDYIWTRHFSLHSGLIFENKGTRGYVELNGKSADVSNRLYYLDVPLMARWNFKTGRMIFFVEAGPYAGFGLTGKAKIESSYQTKAWDINWGSDPGDDFKRFDYGAAGGAGLEWNRLSLEGCFAYGLANIYALGQTGYVIEQRAFSLALGYYFKK